jgi:hypothetical protein
LKHGNTINKNFPKPIPQFPPDRKLSEMRKETGMVSEEDVRRFAKKLKPSK